VALLVHLYLTVDKAKKKITIINLGLPAEFKDKTQQDKNQNPDMNLLQMDRSCIG
jgi:hypothetical protein